MTRGQRRAVAGTEAAVRRSLIEAARQLLAAGPADAVTSRAIAERAGANLAAITYYFGSKDRLVAEALVQTARELLEPVTAVLRSDGEPAGKLLRSVLLLQEILGAHREHLLAYLQALAAAPSEPSIAADLRALHREVTQLLVEQIDGLCEAGELPGWVDPAAMAQLIVGVVHGTLVAVAVDPADADAAGIGAQFGRLLLAVRTPS